jgi:hypothetical protein
MASDYGTVDQGVRLAQPFTEIAVAGGVPV